MNKEDKKSIEGRVLDMQDRDITFVPSSSYAKNKKFKGTQFKIYSVDGIKEIEFPQVLSLTDKKNMRGELVRIIKNEHSVSESGDNYTITQYRLDVLSGYLIGEFIDTGDIMA
jgi:hypothetical protein